jgi:hypothetical protein
MAKKDYVSKDVFEVVIDNLKDICLRMEKSVEKITVLEEENNKHHRNIQAKLFERTDEHGIKIVGIETKVKSTQAEVTEHKNNHWRLTTLVTTLIIAIVGFLVSIKF